MTLDRIFVCARGFGGLVAGHVTCVDVTLVVTRTGRLPTTTQEGAANGTPRVQLHQKGLLVTGPGHGGPILERETSRLHHVSTPPLKRLGVKGVTFYFFLEVTIRSCREQTNSVLKSLYYGHFVHSVTERV